MITRKIAALAAFALTLTPVAVQAQSGCWYPNEARAAQLLHLNTNLMVNALQCREVAPVALDTYNGFVERQIDMLRAHHAILQQRFEREHGASERGRDAYRQYRVSTANGYAAQPAMRDIAACERNTSLAMVASDMSRDQLLMLAASMADAPTSGTCRPSGYSFDAGVSAGSAPTARASIADPWEQLDAPRSDGADLAIPAAPPAPPPAPAPAQRATDPVTATRPPAEQMPAPALQSPEPSPAVAASQRAPASSSDAALKSAVAALQAATTALEAALDDRSSAGDPAT